MMPTETSAATASKHPSSIVFAVGAFGGIAPTLMRFAMDLSQQRVTVAAFDPSILLGVALLGILGGGVATIWRESDLKRVFYLGLGLPSLLTVLTSNATAPKSGLPTVAYVQPGAPAQGFNEGKEEALLRPVASEGTNRLKLIFPAEIGSANAAAVFTGAPDGYSYFQFFGPTGEVVIPPYDPLQVKMITPLGDSDAYAVSRVKYPSLNTMTCKASKIPWAGFWYAVGAKIKPYHLVLESSKTTPISL